MSRIHLRSIVAILAVGLLGWGCNKEAPAPPPPPAKKAPAPKATPVQPGEKAETESAPPKYVYSGVGRRDPFENPLKEIAVPQMKNEEALTPLQKVDLSQLRIVGIIIGRGDPAAMVVGPGGKSYILKKGVKVGKNDGVVVGIDAEKVTIREKYYDFSGEMRTSIQELELPKRGGAK
jgi:type IV pilus assembly protein PilP